MNLWKQHGTYRSLIFGEWRELAVSGHSAPRVRNGSNGLAFEISETVSAALTLVVPFLWVADAGSGVAEGNAGSTAFVGHGSIELEALDSVSSEQVAAYIETRMAKKYNWTEGVSTGVSDYVKAYSTWDYTKKAMDFWAKLTRQRLDEAHGKTLKKE